MLTYFNEITSHALCKMVFCETSERAYSVCILEDYQLYFICYIKKYFKCV